MIDHGSLAGFFRNLFYRREIGCLNWDKHTKRRRETLTVKFKDGVHLTLTYAWGGLVDEALKAAIQDSRERIPYGDNFEPPEKPVREIKPEAAPGTG